MPGIVLRLLYTAIVAVVVWLLKLGACVAALRVQAGTGPMPVESEEIGWRTALAAGGLTLLTPIEIYAYETAFRTGLRDPSFWVIAFAVVPLGGLFLTWAYALDEYFHGVSLFMLYSVFPALALFVLWCLKFSVLDLMLRIL
jgi:hypothetical protein